MAVTENSRQNQLNPSQVQGYRSGMSRPIDSTHDGTNERLMVDASISGVAEVNLDETNDEVAVYGGVNGSETADAATRQIINVDSSGRVTVNPISGQTGVQGSSGVVTASTQRVTLATDVALPTGSNTIGAVTNTVLSVVGGGTEATAQRVTIASDSTGVLSVDDNGGSLTVDGSVTVTQATASSLNATVTQGPGNTSNPWTVQGPVADGGVAPTNPVMVGGKDDSGNVQVLRTLTNGDLVFVNTSQSTALADDVSNTVRLLDDDQSNLISHRVFPFYFDGTTWDRVRGDSTGGMRVQGNQADGAAMAGNPVLIAGQDGTLAQSIRTNSTGEITNAPQATATAQADGATNSPNVPVDDAGAPIVASAYGFVFNGASWDRARGNSTASFAMGPVAHDGVSTANPIIVGSVAVTDAVSPPSPVAVADVVRPWFDTIGRQVVAAQGSQAHDAVNDVDNMPIKVGGVAAADAVTPPTAVASGDIVQAFFDTQGRQVAVAVGAQAHDAANDADNMPLKQGFVAVAHGSTPTEVAASDIVQWHANRQGVPFVMGGVPNVQTSQYLSTAAITDDNLLPAISTGTKYVITRITVTLDEATTVGVGFRLGFGSTTIPAAPATNADAVAGILLTHPGLVPGGGITMGDGSGILGVGGDGEELRVTVSDTPSSGSIHFTVSWYTVSS